MISPTVQKELLQGELADLALYQALRKRAKGPLADLLETFVATETRHAAFWQNTFKITANGPSWEGKMRNALIQAAVFVFGDRAAFLLLEAVETHGIKKYLDVWATVEDTNVREGLRAILTEELLHEDQAVTQGGRAIRPEVIRNAFLGFNDGSVEILGAVNGLVAALHASDLVAVAAFTVSFAGAISMAAGAFLSVHSEDELWKIETLKQAFLGKNTADLKDRQESPLKAGILVGVAYLIGAAMPVIPFLLGASSPIYSILLSGTLILVVSACLSFLSGMSLRRRVLLNAGVLCTAVLFSYAIGLLANEWMG